MLDTHTHIGNSEFPSLCQGQFIESVFNAWPGEIGLPATEVVCT